MALYRCGSSGGTLTRVTDSFTSINGTATITVNGLTEIKYIAVFYANQSYASTAIDLIDTTPYCVAGDSTYRSYGFEGSTSAISGNTFRWKWNGSARFRYVAYGK